MNRFIFIALTMLFSVGAWGQTSLKGTVLLTPQRTAVASANVMLKNQSGRILTFTATDANGRFELKMNASSELLSIQVTKVGLKTYTDTLKNDGKPIEIRMEESNELLNEVTVKADRIRENGDTVTYYVNSFAQKQDKTIGDVLKHMPGIDVAKSGKIQYQGIDINKFYIEGSDLLGGKYGVATNGISHDDIGAVEVLENHQPMQVLRGLSFSDQAAINLKMKDKAKATLLAHGSLSGGFSEQPKGALWQGDIFTMMVTGKYQMITTFKGNNVGQNLSDQLTEFISGGQAEGIGRYVSLSAPVTPNLARNRSYFNRSWMVSSSHLQKTAKGREIKVQIGYNNDRVSAQGASSTTYFLGSGDKIIVEDKNSLSHRDALTGKFVYEANEKSYFLNNTLSTELSWNDLTLNTTGTLSNTQSASMPEYAVTNLLKVIKRFDNNKLVTFTSRNEWNSLPEKLTIQSNGQHYGQNIKQHSFYTDERASLGFVFNKVLLSLDAGLSGYFRNLHTDLYGIEIANLIGAEALTTDYLHVFTSPKFEWSHKKLELTLNLPVNLYSYFFSGAMSNRTEFLLSPSLAARFHFTPRMSLTLRGSIGRSPASLHDIHSASILTDYRSFSAGVDDYYTSSGQSLSATFNYRNGPNGIFVMAMVSYGWSKSQFGTVQNIIDDYVFYSYRSRPSDSRNAVAYLNASKTLDFMRGAIGLRGNYRRMENSLLSQGLQTNYVNDSYSLSPFMNGNLSSYLNWNVQFTWEKSQLNISDMPSRNSNNFIYSGSMTLTPCSLITWTTGGEFYHNQIAEGNNKKMFMLDTKLTFNLSKRIELSFSGTNLLNKKEYSYTSYGTVSQYERSSALRGREFLITLFVKK